jgi:hypothetical protein
MLSMHTDAARKLGLDPDLSEMQLLIVAATLLSLVVCAVEAALCQLNITTFWTSDTVDHIDASPSSQRKRTMGGGDAHATMFKTAMQRYIMRPDSTKFKALTFTQYHDRYTISTAAKVRVHTSAWNTTASCAATCSSLASPLQISAFAAWAPPPLLRRRAAGSGKPSRRTALCCRLAIMSCVAPLLLTVVSGRCCTLAVSIKLLCAYLADLL